MADGIDIFLPSYHSEFCIVWCGQLNVMVFYFFEVAQFGQSNIAKYGNTINFLLEF